MVYQSTTTEGGRPPDPARLITLKDAAANVRVKVEVLRGWVESGHAPHYYVADEGPLFKKGEITEWVRDNHVRVCAGMPAPRRIDVLSLASVVRGEAPPQSIATVEGLCYLGINGLCSGIYFLCAGSEVVYVGQSVRVVSRVADHISTRGDQFDHDRVFFLPCPTHELDELERQFIWLLKPRLNRTTYATDARARTDPERYRHEQEVLAKLRAAKEQHFAGRDRADERSADTHTVTDAIIGV